jgi:hypothetical protein
MMPHGYGPMPYSPMPPPPGAAFGNYGQMGAGPMN